MKRDFKLFLTLIYCLLVALCFNSCASLTKSQLTEVSAFGSLTKDFACVPGKIFSTYNDAETQKQLLLSNTIHSPDTHLASLKEFYKNQQNKSALNKQADAAMQVLSDYGQKLVHLTADVNRKQLDTAALSAGTDLDQLITSYNSLSPEHKIPTGIGSFFGQAVSAAGDIYVKDKQAKAVKLFVTKGDTLVTAVVAAIKDNLSETGAHSLKTLIDTEKNNLDKNYLIYRKRNAEEIKIFAIDAKTKEVQTTPVYNGQADAWHSGSFDADKLYLQCLTDLDTAEQLRQECIKAADELQKAHHKLLQDLSGKKKIKDMYASLQDYASSVRVLYNNYKKVK